MKLSKSTLIQTAIWVSIIAIACFAGNAEDKPLTFYLFAFARVFCLALFFNLAYHFLLPLYFSGKKKAFFILSPLFFVLYVGYSVIQDKIIWNYQEKTKIQTEQTHPYKHKKHWSFLMIGPVFLGLIAFGLAASLRGFSAYEKKKKDADEANRRRLEAELALLKSQINPHFLLNTLNNLYAIALTDPEKTPNALLKLSDMVKFILYDCQKTNITLEEDLDFISNYIELQRLRLAHNMEVRFETTIARDKFEKSLDKTQIPKIEPMILIPFIENAFKHGLTTKEKCEIFISIVFDKNSLNLTVENQVFLQKNKENGNISGIGLINTQQRLEQSYPNKHDLKIENDGKFHKVTLKLIL
jgi:two-component system, LytTR family, sensor kinase